LENYGKAVHMKKIYLTLILISSLCFNDLKAQVVVLEGHYQGRDIYVQNPFSSSGVGFCVYEVRVNNEVTTDEVNSSAFAIDFNMLDLAIGDPLLIEIVHKEGCEPIVINPEVLKPISTYDMVSISVDKNNVLNWVTTNESGKLPYTIEQYRWNKWVKVGEVDGKGSEGENKYQFKLTPNSGENKVRVKQTDSTNKPRYSEVAVFNSKQYEVSYSPVKVKKEIIFSQATMFEVYNMYGNIVMRGYDKTVDVSALQKGKYYINYDNKFGDTFEKK
jgi:hypothetical protein